MFPTQHHPTRKHVEQRRIQLRSQMKFPVRVEFRTGGNRRRRTPGRRPTPGRSLAGGPWGASRQRFLPQSIKPKKRASGRGETMKWENDVASGEGPDSASVAYFSALPFPFGPHSFVPYPCTISDMAYPLVACATRNLASSCQREDYEEAGRGRGRRRLKRQGDGLLTQN